MGSQIDQVWLAEHGKDAMLVRFPFSDRAVKVLCAIIPPDNRQVKAGWGWRADLVAWRFPAEYWYPVEDALGQIFTKVRINIVDELPELEPFSVEDIV